MRFDSSKYRIWKRRQNDKNLRRRTERKIKSKRRKTAVHKSNVVLKTNAFYDSTTKKYSFKAPSNFSIVSNPSETLIAFNALLSHIKNNSSVHKEIFVDVKEVEDLTIDSIMYLLCFLNNFNKADRYRFSGNYPIDLKARKTFFDSGFNKYVKSRVPKTLLRQTDNVQITSGDNIDTSLAKRIVDFIKSNAKTENKYYYIYEMVIELMGNTWKHAYNNDTDRLFDSCWYCYVEIENSKAKITFMDTGIGIPRSIYKKKGELIKEKMDWFNLVKDSEYIASALRGEERTETRLSNRGKGLPSFVEIVNEGYIQKLRIISLNGDVCVEKDKITASDLNKKFFGTLYYWEINL